MNQNEIKQALSWRYATKRFDATRKISESDWETLTNSLKMAPSSYGVQPWRFLDVQNSEIRNQLKQVSWNQSQITDADHLVVLLYKEKIDEAYIQDYVNQVASTRGVELATLEGYKDMMVQNLVKNLSPEKSAGWAQRQTYIAMGFLLETAALLKIDSCPMEGFDSSAYDKILQLEDTGWKSIAVVTLGYRHAEDAFQNHKKVRFPEEQLIKVIR